MGKRLPSEICHFIFENLESPGFPEIYRNLPFLLTKGVIRNYHGF
jgi:hypothetical protein